MLILKLHVKRGSANVIVLCVFIQKALQVTPTICANREHLVLLIHVFWPFNLVGADVNQKTLSTASIHVLFESGSHKPSEQ